MLSKKHPINLKKSHKQIMKLENINVTLFTRICHDFNINIIFRSSTLSYR